MEAIVRHQSRHKSTNYLDDFLFIALGQVVCNGIVNHFLSIFSEINFPVALEKTEWTCTVIVFLGMLVDTRRQIIVVPLKKREKALHLINGLLASKRTTVLKIQQLAGVLGFLYKDIYPGIYMYIYLFT